MLCTSGFVDDAMFRIMDRIGQNQRRHVCFIQFASRTSDGVVWSSLQGWRQRGRSLPSLTASCFSPVIVIVPLVVENSAWYVCSYYLLILFKCLLSTIP